MPVEHDIANEFSFSAVFPRTVERLSDLLLLVLVLLYPFFWLPYITPSVMWTLKQLLLISYIGLRLLKILDTGKLNIVPNSITIPLLIVPVVGILQFGPLPNIYFILFSFFVIDHFYQSHEKLKNILYLFIIWFTLHSLYALVITYSPIAGFEPVVYTGPRSYAELFNQPDLRANSFAFYHRDFMTVPAAFALILSVSLFFRGGDKKMISAMCSVILFLQMVNIVHVTGGSGRAGFVLIVFALIVCLLIQVSRLYLLPCIVISPLLLWFSIYLYIQYTLIPSYLLELNAFMSNRLFLYLDSIDVILSNVRHSLIFGLGPNPWGDYTLEQLNTNPQYGVLFDPVLTRPHNFLLNIFITSGVFVGSVIIYWCIELSRVGKGVIASHPPFDTGVTIALVGSIFVGISVGKMGPFATLTNDMFLWWLCYSYFVLIVIDR